MRILLIGLGGGAGAILRYALATAVQGAAGGPFPLGTLAVNVLGCFGIGLLSGLAGARALASPEARALLGVGVLGGFTTFSAFANETMLAARDGAPWIAGANVLASVALCLAAAWLGRSLVRFSTKVELAGRYRDVRTFIHDLETSPEFVVIDDVSLSEDDDEGGLLQLTLQLSTYYQGGAE